MKVRIQTTDRKVHTRRTKGTIELKVQKRKWDKRMRLTKVYDILDSTNKEEMRSEEKLILLQQVSRRVTYHNIHTNF